MLENSLIPTRLTTFEKKRYIDKRRNFGEFPGTYSGQTISNFYVASYMSHNRHVQKHAFIPSID